MKTRYALLLLVVLFFSCKKKNKDNTNPNNNNAPFSYSVKYDSVVVSQANTDFHFSFYVNVLTGSISDNKLTCTVEGLPSSIAVSPPTIIVSSLLGGVFIFYIDNVAVGDYPFKLKISTEKYGVQVYNLVLRITPPLDYAPFLAGTYDSCYDFCPASGFIYYPSQVTTVTDTPSLIKISNIKNLGSGFVVRAWVSKTITIPMQVVGGKTIWGSGTYSHDGRPGHENDYVMSVKDTLVSGIDSQYCTMHIEH